MIAVASGRGMREVFEQFGAAYVIDGGQTMNPSTGDFLEVIDALPNTEIILLPNNKNILWQRSSPLLPRKARTSPSSPARRCRRASRPFSNTATPCRTTRSMKLRTRWLAVCRA